MNSLQQLEQTLSARRERRKHIRSHTSNERLDLDEVHNTNLEVGLFSGGRLPDGISNHRKDIEYIKTWHVIYKTALETKTIPGRPVLLVLKRMGKSRIEQLEDKLYAIQRFENDDDESIREEYQPQIDLIRWKIKYYQQTLEDGEIMLNILDDHSM
ncbi:hypothetical protein TWF506_003235 [Arthrobotrys conoides]|uniref:Uncharacterized protein n=1 Tax=Arthrobotrys conoides TaxID=74498 RepID=A0AAN8N3N2_9PEZI